MTDRFRMFLIAVLVALTLFCAATYFLGPERTFVWLGHLIERAIP